MKRDTSERAQEQELFLDSAEALRSHIRSQVRQALKEVFEEEIRGLCGQQYRPASSEHYRAGSAPSYVMIAAAIVWANVPEMAVWKSNETPEYIKMAPFIAENNSINIPESLKNVA